MTIQKHRYTHEQELDTVNELRRALSYATLALKPNDFQYMAFAGFVHTARIEELYELAGGDSGLSWGEQTMFLIKFWDEVKRLAKQGTIAAECDEPDDELQRITSMYPLDILYREWRYGTPMEDLMA